MDNNNNILCITSFLPDLSGHGGNRRTAQIAELIESAGLGIENAKHTGSTRFARYIRGISIYARNNFNHLKGYSILGTWGHSYIGYKTSFEQHLGHKLAIWESTADPVVTYLAEDNKYKTIAVPQNIESLVASYGDYPNLKSVLSNLENEVCHLAKSDAIFCISREEQWLLKLFGIESDFLPYYPAKQIFNELLDIRKSRTSSEKSRFLVLGTANNPPTLIGMIEQIKILVEIRKEVSFEVDIAGYGTESLGEHCIDANINLLGTISVSKLHDLMKGAIAVLIHQKAGVGALTRIPEMLIAGIPVIANANACRSAFTYEGTYCYDDKSELAELMTKNLSMPEVLPRPKEAEKRFIDSLLALI